jgi:peptidoglycan/LPS O-acetylase OafA/YrhL
MTDMTLGRAAPGIAAPARARARLSWLDALRGLAALIVVYWHMRPHVPVPVPDGTWRWFDLGKCGVVLFFLISGYIIPMSLERQGNLRRFWISRGFRLYPAFAVAAAFMIAVMAAGVTPFPQRLVDDPLTGVLAHSTMLQGMLGVSNLVPVYWTLSYEMVFYLLVAGLFALNVHRHSGWYAAGLAVFAVLAGPALPQTLLTSGDSGRAVAVVVVTIVVVAAVVCFLVGGRRMTALGAVLGLAMLTLAVVNGGESSSRGSWQTLVLLATMFAGTVIYRMQHRQLGIVPGVAALGTVLVAALAGGWWHLTDQLDRRLWVTAIIFPAALFAAGFLVRNRQMPWALRKLGELSYSLYLLHLILRRLLDYLLPDLTTASMPVRLAALAAYLIVLLGLAELVYRYIEVPAQRVGRRVADRFDSRRDRSGEDHRRRPRHDHSVAAHRPG